MIEEARRWAQECCEGGSEGNKRRSRKRREDEGVKPVRRKRERGEEWEGVREMKVEEGKGERKKQGIEEEEEEEDEVKSSTHLESKAAKRTTILTEKI